MATLHQYRAKRHFERTPEPEARVEGGHRRPIFVVQEHHARRLHYDLRLEADGVLKSWAVPKGPCLDPTVKRLAVHVEDHPLEYAKFQGTIPVGEYGAGEVYIWDRGTYDNLLADKPRPLTVSEGVEAGRLEVFLHGKKLEGRFALVRLRGRDDRRDNWLLIKMRDEYARPDGDAPAVSVAGDNDGKPRRRGAARSGGAEKAPNLADIPLTHPQKLLYPEDGITKADVIDFYARISPWLLPHLKDRPVTLERVPDGVGKGTHFWQKNTPDSYPDWIPRVEIPTERGKPVKYLLVNNIETLLYLVNQGTLTFHVWMSRVQDLDHPDHVLFDLDPDGAPMADVVEVAKKIRTTLQEIGRPAYVKTSGKRGLHVLTPWREAGDYDAARAWAIEIADGIVADMPKTATREFRKARRGGKVYIDVLQNIRGHHAVPPYVLRPVPGAPVSTPLSWREVKANLDPAAFNLRTIFRRLARQKRDPLLPSVSPKR